MKKVLPVVIIILVVVGIVTLGKFNAKKAPSVAITNFEECASAGYPIMESYPRQCRNASGELFVEKIENPTPTPKPVPDTRIAAGYIAGHIDIGPNCPVEQVDNPCPPSPEAYSSREVIVYSKDGFTINERGKIDSKGNYRIAIGPGSYFVQINPAGIGAGEKKPVTVKSFETTTVNFDIDTGIR